MRLKDFSQLEWELVPHDVEKLTPGHRLCAGCGAAVIARQVLLGTDRPVVVCCPTGCLEVSTTIYPFTSWNVPYIHSAFGNAAATISGVEAAYRAFKRRSKLDREIKFLVFAGDGGTYDIGFQALSGALERGHDIVYVCYDNEAYMNTGIQRSSSTPRWAWTTTTAVGAQSQGKQEYKKDICLCVAAHRIPYVAQASPSHPKDLIEKARKAFAVKGPAYLNILSPCPPGWRYNNAGDGMKLAGLAVESCYWPLYEVENGSWRLTYTPPEKLPVTAWIKEQGRFSHLKPGGEGDPLASFQESVDTRWEELLARCGNKGASLDVWPAR
ncbi:MAG: pyruvate ferredoxin oxidoreductase [Chloroflexi bacterium]|nr:pyruvate ferredoxin oxidoreductase [Chloroflexota bacterium]